MLRALLLQLAGAFALLTRLHFPQAPPATQGRGVGRDNSAPAWPNPAECVWAFPIVGATVGAIGGAVYWAARSLAMPTSLAAAWTLAAMIMATGGFHEDGLADTADGFGGGATRERKLAIMRDSRIGTFGVLAVVLSLAVRGAALAAIGDGGRVTAALVVGGALGRAVAVGLALLLPPARADGLGAALVRPSSAAAATGLGLAAFAALVLLRLPLAAGAIVAAASACFAIAWLAWRQIGGHTGDVLGAGEQFAECVVLTLLASALSA